ncbi:MAG: hypothetical protein M5U28_44055 [Sandaracinaceae bacterium]|nr:hypothetical protein [Sandaracinaceae bacterium]
MSGSFLHRSYGRLFVLLHTEDPPDDAGWDLYLESLRALVRSGSDARILALTDGGGPSAPQRARLSETLEKRGRAAVVGSAIVPRFIVSTIALFNRNVRSFSPDEIRVALDYLDLLPNESRRALEILRESAGPGAPRALRSALAVLDRGA